MIPTLYTVPAELLSFNLAMAFFTHPSLSLLRELYYCSYQQTSAEFLLL